jgi:hypothetical protein
METKSAEYNCSKNKREFSDHNASIDAIEAVKESPTIDADY